MSKGEVHGYGDGNGELDKVWLWRQELVVIAMAILDKQRIMKKMTIRD